jgi:hypothetical protein
VLLGPAAGVLGGFLVEPGRLLLPGLLGVPLAMIETARRRHRREARSAGIARLTLLATVRRLMSVIAAEHNGEAAGSGGRPRSPRDVGMQVTSAM